MPATAVKPDDFVLGTDDEQISVSYSTYGIVGPSLTYHNEADPTGVGSYSGAQLRIEESELGELVTVTLEDVPDARRRALTLLLPEIRLDEDQAAAGIDVETLVVWSTIHGGREARGQIQTYDAERRVKGSARLVGP